MRWGCRECRDHEEHERLLMQENNNLRMEIGGLRHKWAEARADFLAERGWFRALVDAIDGLVPKKRRALLTRFLERDRPAGD
jgi:hypothetical protein